MKGKRIWFGISLLVVWAIAAGWNLSARGDSHGTGTMTRSITTVLSTIIPSPPAAPARQLDHGNFAVRGRLNCIPTTARPIFQRP